MKIIPSKNRKEFLRELRQEIALRDVTFKEIAKWLKINPSQVTRMFDGTHVFPLEYLDVILKRSHITSKLYSEILKEILHGSS